MLIRATPQPKPDRRWAQNDPRRAELALDLAPHCAVLEGRNSVERSAFSFATGTSSSFTSPYPMSIYMEWILPFPVCCETRRPKRNKGNGTVCWSVRVTPSSRIIRSRANALIDRIQQNVDILGSTSRETRRYASCVRSVPRNVASTYEVLGL
ncbi:hypothetical protein HYDPIDRAFT_118567 [Hydnomerulius pinastri MD-312]|uniref:Uncharacterized protein n=1 Tax=Hydnomerulius pinastri MD-312 TaxID=994086 RepID=A0A0C9VNV9_9AGAM|nr:hypothetical protein HYDPIDRAFT_118567 [Hydnomerulius pinastri MD-312]